MNASKGAPKPKPKHRRSVVAQDDLFGGTSDMPVAEGAEKSGDADHLAYAETSRSGVYAEPAAGADFSAPARGVRPKMKLKKPKVKIDKSAKPKATTRSVTKSGSTGMPEIRLPEISGMSAGLSGAVSDYEMVESEADVYVGGNISNVESTPVPYAEPQSTESLYFFSGEAAPEPAPVPAAQAAERRYSRGAAVLAKGKKAEVNGRGDGLVGENTDFAEVSVFGSALSVDGEPPAEDAFDADAYAFMDQTSWRATEEGKSASGAGGQAEKEGMLLFGVADADMQILGSTLKQDVTWQRSDALDPAQPGSMPEEPSELELAEKDKRMAGAEADAVGEMLGDDCVALDELGLWDESLGTVKDEGDRSGWLMRKVEPAVFNPYILTAENAFSTFSIDVDTASYGLARQRLLMGGLPEPEQVRTEEFINSFDYDYRPPSGKQTFAVHTEMAPSPFRLGMDALKIGIKGRRIGRDDHRGAVLTLVVDTSGSMSTPERLGLVKESLALLIDQLNPEDSVAIVQFGSEARLVLEHTPASEKVALLDAIHALQPGGPTQFDKGLELGYQLATAGFRAGDSNRIMILSDGVANLGELDPEAILAQVAEQRKQGIYLSVLGFGAGAYDDDMLERLANKGDGMYAYIDTLDEARYLLVDQLAATLHVIASDVKIQVEFNPERVVRYRQLGYENRQLTKEQFRDDTVDAGEVGSGQSVTALYDVELKPAGPADEPIATVYVRYRRADNGAIEEISSRVTDTVRAQRFEDADSRFQLSVCTAEFAERLRRSPYTEGTEIRDIAGRLQPVTLELTLDGQVQELRRLISIAESLEK